MRLLLNENVPAPTAARLAEAGHDVLWARTAMPGASDVKVLSRAEREGRLLLTFDKDFGDLVFRAGAAASAGIILFRTPQPSAAEVSRFVGATLARRDDWAGHFSVVHPNRIRMIPLPRRRLTGD